MGNIKGGWIVYSIEKNICVTNISKHKGIFDVAPLPHISYGHLQAHEGTGSQFQNLSLFLKTKQPSPPIDLALSGFTVQRALVVAHGTSYPPIFFLQHSWGKKRKFPTCIQTHSSLDAVMASYLFAPDVGWKILNRWKSIFIQYTPSHYQSFWQRVPESPVGNTSGNVAVVHKVLDLFSSQASANTSQWWTSHLPAAGANSLMAQKSEVIIIVYFSLNIPQVFVYE